MIRATRGKKWTVGFSFCGGGRGGNGVTTIHDKGGQGWLACAAKDWSKGEGGERREGGLLDVRKLKERTYIFTSILIGREGEKIIFSVRTKEKIAAICGREGKEGGRLRPPTSLVYLRKRGQKKMSSVVDSSEGGEGEGGRVAQNQFRATSEGKGEVYHLLVLHFWGNFLFLSQKG